MTLRERVRAGLRRWLVSLLSGPVYASSDFALFGDGAYIDEDVHVSDPSYLYLGAGAAIYRGSKVICGPGALHLGQDSHLAGDVYVNAIGASVKLGSGVAVGPKAILLAYSNHVEEGKTINESRISGDVLIGDDVFIGAAAIILPGIRIGRRAVIGAGAVVTKDVPDNAIVTGVPASVVRQRP